MGHVQGRKKQSQFPRGWEWTEAIGPAGPPRGPVVQTDPINRVLPTLAQRRDRLCETKPIPPTTMSTQSRHGNPPP